MLGRDKCKIFAARSQNRHVVREIARVRGYNYIFLASYLNLNKGVDHVMKNHYRHPERYFERHLFRLLEAHGFDYTTCNLLGEPTLCYDVADLKTYKNLSEWVPQVCFRFIEWSLRNHGGKCAMKLDWFSARGLTCANPTVVHDANAGGPSPLSDHDPICVDVVAR